MAFTTFAVFFVLIAALMALWVDARFPGLAPKELMPAAFRLAAAFVLAHVAIPAVKYVLAPLDETARAGVVIAVGFAAMTLLMLASLWLIRLAQGLLGGRFR